MSKMPKRVKGITGQRFGRLLVTSYSHCDKHGAVWRVKCDCGNSLSCLGTNLRRGNTKSCGCLKADTSIKHGMCGSQTHNTWKAMKARCLNKNSQHYARYGSLGICSEWANSFDAFFADMGERPDNMTIDRIDNEKGYSPDNCRWATQMQQTNNRRGNHLLTHIGETMSVSQWSRRLGINTNTMHARVRSGITGDRLFAPTGLKRIA